jgi:hypothetical protein
VALWVVSAVAWGLDSAQRVVLGLVRRVVLQRVLLHLSFLGLWLVLGLVLGLE